MYLHVGADVVVSLRQVIAIVNLRTVRKGGATEELLERLKRENRLVQVEGGEPRSLVLTDSGGILSPISAATLKRRSEFGAPFGQALSDGVCHL